MNRGHKSSLAIYTTNIPTPADAALRRGPDVGKSIDLDKTKQYFPTLNSDLNKQLHLIYLSMGDADGLLETYQDARKLLDAQGVKYVTMELPEYGHDWRFWRLNLEDFVPRLFSTSK